MSTIHDVQAQALRKKAYENVTAQQLQATLSAILQVLGEINQKLGRLVKERSEG